MVSKRCRCAERSGGKGGGSASRLIGTHPGAVAAGGASSHPRRTASSCCSLVASAIAAEGCCGGRIAWGSPDLDGCGG